MPVDQSFTSDRDWCPVDNPHLASIDTKAGQYEFFLVLSFLLALTTNNGLPLTVSVFREFGDHPSNVGLIFVLVYFFFKKKRTDFKIPRYILISLAVYFFDMSINIFSAVLNVRLFHFSHPPVVTWILQSGVFFWPPLAVLGWIFVISRFDILGRNYNRFHKISCWIAAVSLFAFINIIMSFAHRFVPDVPSGLFAQGDLRFLIGDPIGSEVQDIAFRPSVFTTEPSHYAIWCAAIWPFLVFVDTTKVAKRQAWVGRALGLLIALSGALNLARTGVALYSLQIAALLACVFLFRLFSASTRLGLLLLAPIVSVALLVSVGSIFDLSKNQSALSRWSAELAALSVFNDHPLLGAGIGGYQTHVASALPDFALQSRELKGYNSLVNYAFNPSAGSMFFKLGAELGLLGMAAVATMVIGPILLLIWRYRQIRNSGSGLPPPSAPILAVVLCSTAAVGSWYSNDDANQPTIPLFAAMAIVIEMSLGQSSRANMRTAANEVPTIGGGGD